MKRLALSFLILIITLSGCVPKVHSRTFFAMDTFIDITGDKDGVAEKEIKRIDALLSVTNDGSDISKYNRGEVVTDETQALIDRCEEIRKVTDGAFDISVQSAVELWDVKNTKAPHTLTRTAEIIFLETFVRKRIRRIAGRSRSDSKKPRANGKITENRYLKKTNTAKAAIPPYKINVRSLAGSSFGKCIITFKN